MILEFYETLRFHKNRLDQMLDRKYIFQEYVSMPIYF